MMFDRISVSAFAAVKGSKKAWLQRQRCLLKMSASRCLLQKQQAAWRLLWMEQAGCVAKAVMLVRTLFLGVCCCEGSKKALSQRQRCLQEMSASRRLLRKQQAGTVAKAETDRRKCGCCCCAKCSKVEGTKSCVTQRTEPGACNE